MKKDKKIPSPELNELAADPKKISALKGKIIVIKVGGNALTDETIKDRIVGQVAALKGFGLSPVLVHGGGIEIKQLLDDIGIVSEFIDGHRKTDEKSIRYIEMALSGCVNKELVSLLHQFGVKAAGISGKDTGLVLAKKRVHTGKNEHTDLGFVGDVDRVNPQLIQILLHADIVPVVSPVSIGYDGQTYNINADMFAGHLSGALGAHKFIVLTNIDGLLEDVNNPDSILYHLTRKEARALFGTSIQGGMIPKIEACIIALDKGVKSAHIVNGIKKCELLRILLSNDQLGTTIT